MVDVEALYCPRCGGVLKHYDMVRRIVRTGGGVIVWFKIERVFCKECGSTHRRLPPYLSPYKQYSAKIIYGFISGQISIFDLEYEDYPCEGTVKEWKSRNLHGLL